MPSLGARPLVDVTDGDTPNLRMPVRMLSVDTPEVTADTAAGAARIDGSSPMWRSGSSRARPRSGRGWRSFCCRN
jgi:hypothetical protein